MQGPDEYSTLDRSDEPKIVKITGHATASQPVPYPTQSEPIYKMVLADIAERALAGRDIYGTFLQADNERDHLVDAYQEAIDLMFYLRAEIEKRNNGNKEVL